MSLPPDDGSRLDEFKPGNGPTIVALPEDDPMAAFASEQNDRVEKGTIAGALPPADADLLRAAPDESLRSALAQPARSRAYRVATRVAVAAAVVAITAGGAYLYTEKPGPLNEQIADTLADTQVFPARTEADTAVAPSTESHTPAPAETITTPLPRQSSNRNAPRDMERPSPLATVPEDSATSASPEVAAASTDADGPAEPSPLSGEWVMTTRVETSRLKRYEGLRLGYHVTLRQDGNRISGTGWKVSEDEQTIGATARTPISLDGTLNDDRLELTFTEGGRLRVTAGKLVLARDSENALRGRFSSTAAQSFGVVEIHR